MELSPSDQRRGWELGKFWGLVLFPFVVVAMAIGAPLSMLYSVVHRRSLRRRSRALEQRMRAAGRLMAWTDFTREMDQGHGTLIIKRSSFKGPVDWWWTAENTYQLCPYRAVDWLTMLRDESFQPLSEWYKEHYTSIKTGRASLVAAGHGGDHGIDFGRKLVTTGLDVGVWVEIPPAEKLERRKKPARGR